MHLLGDISRKNPGLCSIHGEDDKDYIGNWVEGFGFINVRFPKETTRELTQEEKDKWDGVVIGINDSPRYVLRTKGDAPVKVPKESPIIVLPDSKERQEQLKAKLKEYQGRIDPYRHPALQMGAICKKTVLERLLKDGKINTWELSEEMSKTYGLDFDAESFDNACAVIKDYCKTGGAHTKGGTGLVKARSH